MKEFNTAFRRWYDYDAWDYINLKAYNTIEEQKQKLLQELNKAGIYEKEDFEPFIDRISEQVRQAMLKQRNWSKLEDNYTKKEAGIKNVKEVYPDGIDGDEIQVNKAIKKVGSSANDESGKPRKWRIAKELIEKIASHGYYGYLVLRRKLGIPLEHPTLKPWYAKFLPWIPQLINPGGMVLLREGVYNLSSSILVDNPHITLAGVGWGTKIEYTNAVGKAIHVGSINSVENIAIKDMYIIDTDDTSDPANAANAVKIADNANKLVTIDNVRVDQAGGDAFLASYTKYGWINKCFAHRCYGAYGPFHPHGNHEWIITNNLLVGGRDGEAVRHGAVIACNYFYNPRKGILGGSSGDGFYFNSVIADNLIYNFYVYYGISAWANNVIIANNVINTSGTYLTQKRTGIIVAQTFDDSPRHRTIVTGNHIQNVESEGILVQGGQRNIIAHNFIYNVSREADANTSGIVLEDLGTNYCMYNILKNNTIYCDDATIRPAYGIAETGNSNYNRIIGNEIEGMATGAIYIVGANTIVRDNVGFPNITTKTADYSMTWADKIILADASGAAITITLPDPAAYPDEPLTIKKIDSSANAVTVAPYGAETIDGAASQTLASQYDTITVVSDGTNWYIVG